MTRKGEKGTALAREEESVVKKAQEEEVSEHEGTKGKRNRGRNRGGTGDEGEEKG